MRKDRIASETDLKRVILAITLILVIALLLPTISFSQPPQEPVALGQAAGFAVLAASLISSVPTSAIIGDVGLSPAAGSQITGLTIGEVDGNIYTVDDSGPAGSTIAVELLTAAKGDLTVAFNDAAGRTPVPEGDFLNPGVGDIGGLTLVPGLYRFTSTAAITGSDVTLSGSSTDVWIFQIGADLNVAGDIQVILADGAQAGNVFWQVGTSAILGTNCDFKGILLADQSISLNTGATVEGRLLASIAAVTLVAATVTEPALPSAFDDPGTPVPDEFAMQLNYPNPFNPSTQIEYTMAKQTHVALTVYDLLGHEVATLVNRNMNSGNHTTTWHASNFSSGVYFIRMETADFHATQKVVLVR